MDSTVVLSSLRVKANGDIMMSASDACVTMLCSRVGLPTNFALRVKSFDFMKTQKSTYVGKPDQVSPDTVNEAYVAARVILTAYRAARTHELVFPDDTSYANWYAMSRRVPSGKDLAELAHRMGIHVPFLNIPYLESEAEPFRVNPAKSEDTIRSHHRGDRELKITATERHLATPAKLQKLASFFSNSNSK